jgi:cell wall-associated NlpC family hydrolase
MPSAIEIPDSFWGVRYNGSCYPGAVSDMTQGANCQLFAYELLRHHGLLVPSFRSSDLWDDTEFTEPVSTLEPLDLLLFNNTAQAWGAHVAVYLGDGKAIHLAKEAGRPAVWTLEQFASHPLYTHFIGAKRVRQAG